MFPFFFFLKSLFHSNATFSPKKIEKEKREEKKLEVRTFLLFFLSSFLFFLLLSLSLYLEEEEDRREDDHTQNQGRVQPRRRAHVIVIIVRRASEVQGQFSTGNIAVGARSTCGELCDGGSSGIVRFARRQEFDEEVVAAAGCRNNTAVLLRSAGILELVDVIEAVSIVRVLVAAHAPVRVQGINIFFFVRLVHLLGVNADTSGGRTSRVVDGSTVLRGHPRIGSACLVASTVGIGSAANVAGTSRDRIGVLLNDA